MDFKQGLVLAFCIHLGTVASVINNAKNPCPTNWVQSTWVDMGCLLLNTTKTYSWEQASVYCQTENATLVEIKTEEQFRFLQMVIKVFDGQCGKHHWWTAGTDMGLDGHWAWMRSFTPVGDFLWVAGNPNGGLVENCMYLNYDYGYFAGDAACTTSYYPICQKIDL